MNAPVGSTPWTDDASSWVCALMRARLGDAVVDAGPVVEPVDADQDAQLLRDLAAVWHADPVPRRVPRRGAA